MGSEKELHLKNLAVLKVQTSQLAQITQSKSSLLNSLEFFVGEMESLIQDYSEEDLSKNKEFIEKSKDIAVGMSFLIKGLNDSSLDSQRSSADFTQAYSKFIDEFIQR